MASAQETEMIPFENEDGTSQSKGVFVYNLTDGLVSKISSFYVDFSQAEVGILEINIIRNFKHVNHEIREVTNTKYEVNFVPNEAAIYYANIFFNNVQIQGVKIFTISLVNLV